MPSEQVCDWDKRLLVATRAKERGRGDGYTNIKATLGQSSPLNASD